MVVDLDIEEYVQFRGDVCDSKLMQCYEDVDMFILSCIVTENGYRDGVPVAMMEAMAMGLPVISTNVSKIPELVEDGVSGILVPPKDEKVIADVIVFLCKDGELRVEIEEKGRTIIGRKYKITFETEELIKKIIRYFLKPTPTGC